MRSRQALGLALALIAGCSPAAVAGCSSAAVALPQASPTPAAAPSATTPPPSPDALRGTVTGPSGDPIEGALVALVPHIEPDGDEGEPGVILARSERGGVFHFAAAPPGRYGVTATSPGKAAAYGGVVTIAGSKAAPPATLKLGDEGITVSGVVRDEAGAAVAFAMVDAFPFVEDEGSVFVTTTAADGRYALTIPGGVPLVLVVDAPPRPRAHRQLAPKSQVADVTLEGPPAPRPSDDAIRAWIKERAIPIAAVDAGHGAKDLEPLRRVVGDARIVGLGEATHGSSEFFRMKHRLFEFLVEEMGFTTFALEVPFSEAIAVNEYVLHGKGDPAAALAGLVTWVVNTDEVLEMIRWMRRYNEAPAHKKKVELWGFDILTPAAVEAVVAYLKKVDPPAAKAADEALAPMRLFSADQTYPGSSPEVLAKTQEGIAEMVSRFDAQKKAYIARSSAAAWEIARQHAEVVRQAEVTYRDASLRDAEMARNVGWLLDHPARGGKMVLWAHNNHIALTPRILAGMGSDLRARYGKDYLAVGFAFDKGAFRALDATDPDKPWRPARSFSIGPAPQGSLDAAFALAQIPLFAVDLRDAPAPVAAWLDSRSPMRIIRGFFVNEQRAIERHAPRKDFDAMIFVEQVTASHPRPAEAGAR